MYADHFIVRIQYIRLLGMLYAALIYRVPYFSFFLQEATLKKYEELFKNQVFVEILQSSCRKSIKMVLNNKVLFSNSIRMF